MKVTLMAHTPEPDKLCGMAAMGDRDSRPAPEMGEEDWKGAVIYATNQDHMGIVEHANFTFNVEGVSRALTHQLVRHRIASFDQQSQRAVKINSEEQWYVDCPKTITGKARDGYENMMRCIAETYTHYVDVEGIPPEDARFILPNACKTNITVTMNARALLNFLELRCCLTAQWEIRELAHKMRDSCKEVAPIIFRNAGPPCLMGGAKCPQPDVVCKMKK